MISHCAITAKLKPTRRPPSLSVVIRGVLLTIHTDDIESELREEGHTITKCIRIMCNAGPTYLVQVLTNSQDTINPLLTNGAYIYRERHRVEPLHSPPSLSVRCEKYQVYNSHPTFKCPNEPKCAFCSGLHGTKVCPNTQTSPKYTTCNEQHPTFSYKCKARPAQTRKHLPNAQPVMNNIQPLVTNVKHTQHPNRQNQN